MDGNRFDDLSRKLATGMSRRKALAGIAAGIAGALGLRGAAEAQVSQAYCGNVSCRTNPGKCKEGCVCCIWDNGNSRCMPTCTGGSTPACPPGLVYDPARGGCVAPCTGAGTPGNCPPPAATSCQVVTCAATGICSYTSAPNNTACGGGSICCGGTCTANTTASTCGTCGNACSGATPYCVGGTCVACRTPVDCPTAAPGTCQGARTCSAAGVCGFAPLPAGTICRAATGDCDLAETCDGDSIVCPTDVVKTQGTVCRAAAPVPATSPRCVTASVSCARLTRSCRPGQSAAPRTERATSRRPAPGRQPPARRTRSRERTSFAVLPTRAAATWPRTATESTRPARPTPKSLTTPPAAPTRSAAAAPAPTSGTLTNCEGCGDICIANEVCDPMRMFAAPARRLRRGLLPRR